MEIVACALCVGMVLFLCAFLGFRCGLRLGMRAAKGVEPAPIRSPVRVIKDGIEAKAAEKAAKEQGEMWAQIEEYDGYTDAERKLLRKAVD